ncbi:MAG: DNA cytosine methyltransferase [Pseudomonas sp.]|nr:DNA cytosine methyltransferase [Pseudomonas sp.]MDZ4192897.1 DNA cytosine methyltransferase [Pseudomonas sp.]
MTAYYNEIDPYAAEWLRNLIRAGHIAPGVVDERSIEDVKPDELLGYTQCHFFAGVGVWSLALRRAGWPDNRPVWTGSCPCQPFSSAGAQAGFDDERHLWPAFQWLIEQCQPTVVFGEQVASKAVDPWVDLVHADLEAMGYAFGAVPFPSAGIGAPHIRDRLYWVGDAHDQGLERHTGNGGAARRRGSSRSVAKAGVFGGMANSLGVGCNERRSSVTQEERNGATGNGGDASRQPAAGPVNGFWADADWLFCRDGKWRPVRPGTFPLVDGAPARVGRLRAYGNAVNVEAATQFIAAWMEATQ